MMTPREIGQRAVARRLAMQAVYQMELTEQSADDALAQFHEDELAERADMAYFDLLVTKSTECKDAIMEQVTQVSDTDIGTIDAVERALILIGACEILHIDEIDKAVAVSEAVRLAKKFGAVGGHKFVNSVLDKL